MLSRVLANTSRATNRNQKKNVKNRNEYKRPNGLPPPPQKHLFVHCFFSLPSLRKTKMTVKDSNRFFLTRRGLLGKPCSCFCRIKKERKMENKKGKEKKKVSSSDTRPCPQNFSHPKTHYINLFNPLSTIDIHRHKPECLVELLQSYLSSYYKAWHSCVEIFSLGGKKKKPTLCITRLLQCLAAMDSFHIIGFYYRHPKTFLNRVSQQQSSCQDVVIIAAFAKGIQPHRTSIRGGKKNK